MFYAQSTVKDNIRAKQNVFLPQVKKSDDIVLAKLLENAGKTETIGMLKPCKQAQHAKLHSVLLQRNSALENPLCATAVHRP